MAVNNSFMSVINSFTERTKDELLNVTKNAIQDLVNEAQTTVKDGGKMRVDTGFLRHSGAAALNVRPSGESVGRKRVDGEVGVLPEYVADKVGDDLAKTLGEMKIGDTFYYGWTAWYARYRELYDGFLISAIMNWDNNVRKHAKRADSNATFGGME